MNDRWHKIFRPYTWDDIKKLQGRTKVEHTLARIGAEKLWKLVNSEQISALGALTGNQAVQYVQGGMRSIYCSGWQVAADGNLNGETYPDQSLYAANSVPSLVRRINKALLRAEQIECAEGTTSREWMVPIVADAEAGFGGPLNAYELMKGMIEAGAAGVHFEDQLASSKKCGHLAGKVLVPTSQFVQTLVAARLAADVLEVPTLIIARTDALSAKLLTSCVDENDWPFLDGDEQTPEGFYRLDDRGMDRCIQRGLAYAPYADMLWFETSEPDLDQAIEFAARIHERFPNKLLSYNLSPSFNWRRKMNDQQIAAFMNELAKARYNFCFITLAGWHALSYSSYELAKGFSQRGMPAYVQLQDREFSAEPVGYTATKHQRTAGTGYFDTVSQIISGGTSSTLAMQGSTEEEQFSEHKT